MPRRLKVLISAYACEPNKGSEPEVGWQWALQMARYHDVTVLTRHNNRGAIEAELAEMGGLQPVPKFVYHDRHPLLLDMKRRAKAIKLYYVLWQRSARDVVTRLHEMDGFDLMHHVTFAGFRYPTAVWGHGVACIWGPVGGIESIPIRLLPWHHPVSLAHEVLRNFNNLLQAAPIYVLPKRARATTTILASTKEMQQTFKRLGFEAELVPAIGLNTGALPYQAHRAVEGPLKLLFVGNIITLKGVDLALEALKAAAIDATLTLVGSGNYTASAKELAEKLGIADRVIFRGRLPREEVLTLYREYDVFVFPSLHDTGGYALIEAMFNELPAICLDCGGPAVAVREGCGMKVALGTRKAVIVGLAKAMRWYNEHRSEIFAQGKAAHQSVVEHYSWEVKGARMSQRYAAAVERYSREKGDRKRGYSGMGGFANLVHQMFSLRGLLMTFGLLSMVGALGFLSLGHLKTQTSIIVDDTLPGLSFAGEANANQAQAFNRTLMLLMTDDAERQKKLHGEIDALSQRTSACLARYKEQMFESTDQALFAALLKRRRHYLEVRQRTIQSAESDQRLAALQLYNAELAPAYQDYREAGEQLFKYNIRQGRARGQSIMAVCTVTQFAVAGIGIVVFLAGFLIGLLK